MVDLTSTEIKERVIAYLRTVSQAKNRDVAAAINVSKSLVDKAVNELATEDRIEFLYVLGTSYVALKGSEQNELRATG